MQDDDDRPGLADPVDIDEITVWKDHTFAAR